jgi:amidase
LTLAAWADNGLCEPDADIRSAFTQTLQLLADLGHHIVEIPNPSPWDEVRAQGMFAAFGGMISGLVNAAIPPERRPLLADITGWLFELGERSTAGEFFVAIEGLSSMAGQFQMGIEPYDAVVTPVTTSPAVPVGYFHRDGLQEVGRRMLEWAAYAPLANMTGLPAISLPVQVTSSGVPVSVQITGSRHGDDGLLFSLGAQLEAAVGWQHRHPPQWDQ